MSSSAASLYLDPQIRDWVLFPITLVMILVGILRHYVTILLTSPPKKLSRAAIREQRALLRSQILRATSSNSPLPPSYYKSLSASLWHAFDSGTYLKDGPPKDSDAPTTPANPLTNPDQMEGMMDGMKKQLVMMVPQMVIMGFVAIKLPFPLTLGFKSMLQRGVETQDMDVRWVSSLSWYFLNFFGLNGVYRLILGNDNAADSSKDLANSSPFAAATQQQAGPQDYNKLFKAEKDNLELAEGLYSWAGKGVELRVLQKYGKVAR
ncbi:integral membrane protein DUF106-domain-containing protein [Gautieria morchelliformis]|nr:integral membrane protein DUF106-domain-containing protein [Gautieria morchelliformis]